MKKYILSTAIIIIVIILGGLYLASREDEKAAKKTAKESIVDLFSKKYNRSADMVLVEVGTDTGSFAKGTIRFADKPGGGLWFAAKTAGGWELAFDGNGIVPCDAANKYNFPRDIIPRCIENLNENKLIER